MRKKAMAKQTTEPRSDADILTDLVICRLMGWTLRDVADLDIRTREILVAELDAIVAAPDSKLAE